MIVYMILDRLSGDWWSEEHGWVSEQQGASVYENEPKATEAMRRSQAHSAHRHSVKVRFALAACGSDILSDMSTVVAVGGEVWIRDLDLDSWICGTPDNGCGVYNTGSRWGATVVVECDVTVLDQDYESRGRAMEQAIKYFQEHNDDKG